MFNNIAWRLWDNRLGRPKAWSKTHRTRDERTTLCGRTIPQDAYDTDNWGAGDECRKCRVRARAQGGDV